MRKSIAGIFALLAVAAIGTSCSDDKESIISIDSIPESATSFISSHYPNAAVTTVISEGSGQNTEYDVYFADGSKIEFDNTGQWTNVDAPFGVAIPGGIAPAAIADYVATNYPNNGINEISRDRKGYEVELTNGLDLEFATDGTFVRVDR